VRELGLGLADPGPPRRRGGGLGAGRPVALAAAARGGSAGGRLRSGVDLLVRERARRMADRSGAPGPADAGPQARTRRLRRDRGGLLGHVLLDRLARSSSLGPHRAGADRPGGLLLRPLARRGDHPRPVRVVPRLRRDAAVLDRVELPVDQPPRALAAWAARTVPPRGRGRLGARPPPRPRLGPRERPRCRFHVRPVPPPGADPPVAPRGPVHRRGGEPHVPGPRGPTQPAARAVPVPAECLQGGRPLVRVRADGGPAPRKPETGATGGSRGRGAARGPRP